MTFLTLSSYKRRLLAASIACTFLLHPLRGTLSAAPSPKKSESPNILFFIMDDVGIDQMLTFGYGGGAPPRPPHNQPPANARGRLYKTPSTTQKLPPPRHFL